jgi:transcription-repair coupling factor (superfamily II helicase)
MVVVKQNNHMESLLESIRQLSAFSHLLTNLKSKQPQPGLALPRAVRLPLLATLQTSLDQPILLITDRSDHALQLHDEMAFWAPDSPRYIFSEPNPLFYENAAWGMTTRRERLHTMKVLATYFLPYAIPPDKNPIIITSARALMTRTIPRRDFLKASKLLKVGLSISQKFLLDEWVRLGYQPSDTVLDSGQFSHRGGLVDIWPQSEKYPVRLDFFGDEVDSIRRFDPATQRTVDKLEAVLITPAREFIIQGTGPFENDMQISEFHIPILHPYPSCLLDYLPKNALVVVDDWDLLETMVSEIEEQALKLRAEYIADGTLSAGFPVPYLSWSELNDNLNGRCFLELGRSNADQLSEVSGDFERDDGLAAQFTHPERFGGRLKLFTEYLIRIIEESNSVVVVSRQASRLEELWREHNPQSSMENPSFIEGCLSEGWKLGSSYLITDSEIFGWERPQPRQRPRLGTETPEAAYADLQPGDWVVHVDYGLGKFIGLVQRTLEGIEREFLCVEYKNGDQVFVPIHQADRLTRYIGPDGSPPVPGNLGSQEWPETKRKVQDAVREVAQELLELYARRQVSEGFAFSTDTAWQGELESSFPYVETDDQIKALKDIKRDMENPRPMDRLLCGDVGYGKTEVALRAAFKAVMDGRQVALLVPTTVLAQQHYDTFVQRLSAFPVTVEMLSRFRTPREQDQILTALSQGSIDIVIGTHRLISADVQFKDLGLVIIDEEQRFGVTHKEHLKKLRTEVDVLTLTATPIPRTLYMALTGVRDISNLNTPPDERLPIITHVGPYSPKLVRQAILRELERGGQVFFVHNRVQTIEAMRMHLEKLVPEARIAIGHGQMPETGLASVMHRFTAGEIDILLSTSIIESGLDIPNANTLIVDRADAFGLSQLYQLRGRVGRGAARAYAYFFRHRKFMPTPDGQERLDVIAENTQLGAGYSIAMRDLEMRGAGEMLGTRQSGYIAAVGFHLYTRLLAAAVKQARKTGKFEGLKLDLETANLDAFQPIGLPVNVDLPIAIGIPDAYVQDMHLRLRLYRRLADMTDEAALEAIAEEFVDRFGDLPDAVSNLFFQIRVKLRAEGAGLISVGMESGQILLRYAPPPEGTEPRRLQDLGSGVRGGKNAYWCSFGKDADWQEKLLDTLEQLKQ